MRKEPPGQPNSLRRIASASRLNATMAPPLIAQVAQRVAESPPAQAAAAEYLNLSRAEPAIAPEASPKRKRGGIGTSRQVFLADASGSLRARADIAHLTLTIAFPGRNAAPPVGGHPKTAKFNYYRGPHWVDTHNTLIC